MSIQREDKDHNYSDANNLSTFLIIDSESYARQQLYKSNTLLQKKTQITHKGKTSGQVKNIQDLKKVTPCLKLLGQEAESLNQLKKNLQPVIQERKILTPEMREEMSKYCRTCAGQKVPLVDIFSVKGIQMRLSQQIQHLEDITEQNSLTTQMCMDCICDLKMSYKFFMQIKKAEMKLKSIHSFMLDAAERAQGISNQDNVIDNSSYIILQNVQGPLDISETLTPDTNERGYFENIKLEPETNEQMALQTTQTEDTESIEEFDPDDPPFQPDTSDAPESDDDIENKPTMRYKKSRTNITKNKTSDSITEVKSWLSASTIELQSNDNAEASFRNIKLELTDQSVMSNEALLKTLESPTEIPDEYLIDTQNQQSTKDNLDERCKTSIKDGKMQKVPPVANFQNILSTPSKDDGIMYVTVKGSRPNELLLVKVKKMDKPTEVKKISQPEKANGKSTIDIIRPIEKMLSKYDALLKDKDLFSNKKSEEREQIIEEQIEEYKRKREKILGRTAVIESIDNESIRMRDDNSIEIKTDMDPENDPSKIKVEVLKTEVTTEEDMKNMEMLNLDEAIKEVRYNDKTWKDEMKIPQTVQTVMMMEPSETDEERLVRILGDEGNKHKQDFLDYLKSRRIVLARLKDEDIITLYDGRYKTDPFEDGFKEKKYLDCDFCLRTFVIKEKLEEHMKCHDFKILHYCEDCGEEFTTNKAKRNHNIICIKKLICRYCDMILDSKGKKRQHEQKHCDSMYGQLCDICGEKFKHQGTLDQHIKTRHMDWEKIFQCPKCPKKFAFKTKLSFHVKSVHTAIRAYLCEDCGADFKNPASLRHHRIRKHQPVGNKRQCSVCSKLVPFYSLSKHMHTHKAYTIKCPYCDKMFKNTSTLKQHTRIHEDQRPYRCNTCGSGFNRRDGLRLHMKVHEKPNSRGVKECSCQVCGEKFPNHSMLVMHRNRVHKDGRPYTCRICNRSMVTLASLQLHLSHIHNEASPKTKDDSSEGSRRVSCYQCNKTFKTEMILRTHVKNTHTQKDPVKCLDCDQMFTSDVRLRHHMMVEHKRLEGTLQCPHCPKRFVNQLRLKTHMISHSEVRPFTCDICGFMLKTKIQLVKHHQNRHSDVRPLQCPHCPWRCKQVSALVCHERTHTNERPYECSVCQQKFKYLGDKNKHERRHEVLGGAGFKRIVAGRNNNKRVKSEQQGDTSTSEQEETIIDQNMEVTPLMVSEVEESQYSEVQDTHFIKFESQELTEECQPEEGYPTYLEQEYEETSKEASEAPEVIMNIGEEDGHIYTEEVTADNIEGTSSPEIITSDLMTNQILQSGTVVHFQQPDENGKLQVIPVMLSLPDISDANAEVNLATASIMYNN